jgi:putative selenium metabolism hydrolase
VKPEQIEAIREAAREEETRTAEALLELIRIPSFSGRETRVVEHVADRMREARFDEVRIDPFGNVLGRIGRGRRVLAFDAHLDTVEPGDLSLWKVDPFAGETSGGVIYGRGASDQKGGMAALLTAGALIKKLAIEGDTTVWIVGSVLEEDCDGLCWHYILSEGELRPEVVVLPEPTDLRLTRGQRGRMEIEVTTRGISCHGSAPERGVNAVSKMAPVIERIDRLNTELPADPFLGPGSVTISEIRSTSPSLCAVADSCTIHLDRRLSQGETEQSALGQVQAILRALPETRGEIRVPEFRRATHTGLLYPMRQYFPPWALPESHEFVQMGLRAREMALGEKGEAGKWVFSTNGVATMGLHGVPSIGFGPAAEVHAHAPSDQCPIAHLSAAAAFYVTFTALFAERIGPT